LTSKKEQFYIQCIADLQAQLKQRDERIDALEKQVAELIKVNTQLTDKVAELSKNSSNSSKPTRKTKSNTPRKIGAQLGHAKHERPLFSTEEIDDFQTHVLDACPDCGGVLTLVKGSSRIVQQVEIVEKPVSIEQHTTPCYWCEHCQKFHYAPLPANIEKGQLAGPHLTAIVAYMKGACHCSFSTIRKFLRDAIGVTISRVQLSKLVQKAAAALEQAYNELLEYLPYEAKLNIDETGHKENGNRFWTWCFRGNAYTLRCSKLPTYAARWY
jgi:transposase